MDIVTYGILKKLIDDHNAGKSSSDDITISATENLLGVAGKQRQMNTLIRFVLEHRTYTGLINEPATHWVITHNMYNTYNAQGLGALIKNPSVCVLDGDGKELYGGVVTYLDSNSLIIDFDRAVSGSVILYF